MNLKCLDTELSHKLNTEVEIILTVQINQNYKNLNAF